MFFSRVIGEQIVIEMAPTMGTMVARVLVLDLLAEEGQALQSDLVRHSGMPKRVLCVSFWEEVSTKPGAIQQ